MKKITDLLTKKFMIDPSLLFDDELSDLIDRYKIKVQAYRDDPKILWNLYSTAVIHFSVEVMEEIFGATLRKEDWRELQIDMLLKKEEKEYERKQKVFTKRSK